MVLTIGSDAIRTFRFYFLSSTFSVSRGRRFFSRSDSRARLVGEKTLRNRSRSTSPAVFDVFFVRPSACADRFPETNTRNTIFMDVAEHNSHVRRVFGLLDEVAVHLAVADDDGLVEAEIKHIVLKHVDTLNCSTYYHAQRLTHFVLYLNTDLEHCGWIKNEAMLKQYMHTVQLPRDVYYTIAVLLKLRLFMTETIAHTPYRFCRDLIEITLATNKTLNSHPQLTVTENLVLALLKNANQISVESDLQPPLTANFNEAMIVFSQNHLPNDVKKLDINDERKEVQKYNGFRLKSIFKIFVEIIKYNVSKEPKVQFALYENLTSCVAPTSSANVVFKQFFNLVMHKCIEMCDFSVDAWISWYEVEVVDENTNLQSAIGYLCHELCTSIENGTVDEEFLRGYQTILRHIAIEKVDFTGIDSSNIDGMIQIVEKHSSSRLNNLVKLLMENDGIFSHSLAISKLELYVEHINYECFSFIVDRCMSYYKCSETSMFDLPVGSVLLKGIMHLDTQDKHNLLKHILKKYSDSNMKPSSNFTDVLNFVIKNEHSKIVSENELRSKVIWLILQQPRRMLTELIAQHVSGICGLPPKQPGSKKSFLDSIILIMHLCMHDSIIIGEYFTWLDHPLKEASSANIDCLYHWIKEATKSLQLLKPQKFLKHVLTPLLHPTSDISHMLLLVALTKFFFNECQLSSPPTIEVWDRLLIQFAHMLEKNRWNIDNYSALKIQLCEDIILAIQPILYYGIYSGVPKEFNNVRNEVSSLSLMTRAHFMSMWTAEYITIDGMEEQFIMTIHSKSHISYSNLNESSPQKTQEEFIFSIATFMPKFTTKEMNSFIANYLSSTNDETIVKASFFLWDCVMNACMRTIVYLKTAGTSTSLENSSWDYLDNTIINFIDSSNRMKTNCIFKNDADPSIKFNSLCKIFMVTKHLNSSYQVTLLIIIRHLIKSIMDHLDAEKTAKLLNLIASLNGELCKEKLGSIIESLTNKLVTFQSSNPSV